MSNEPKYNSVFSCRLNYGEFKNMLLEPDDKLTLVYNSKEDYRDFNFHCSYEKTPEELYNFIYEFAKTNIKEY